MYMKKIYRIACLFFLLAGLAMPAKTIAQGEEDLSAFLQAGAADASKLIEAYVEPTVKSISYGMTGGWYTTAKAHKTLGFDLSVTLNAAFIPSSENFFNPNKLNFANTTYNGARPNGSSGAFDPDKKAPTMFGSKDETEYESTYDPDGSGPLGDQTYVFRGPEGFNVKNEIGIAAIPTPMVQLGIGIIKNTDIKLRFVPKQSFGESDIKMFGIGIMHDIKQHFKGIKLMPFDLSALVAFNSVSGNTDLSSDGSGGVPESTNGVGRYKFNSWVIQGLISKKISVLTGYAGVGYNIVDTKIDVEGDYVIVPEVGSPGTVSDPVSIDFQNNSMRLTLGMRLKLGPVYFNGDYTISKFNTLSVGFGFSVR